MPVQFSTSTYFHRPSFQNPSLALHRSLCSERAHCYHNFISERDHIDDILEIFSFKEQCPFLSHHASILRGFWVRSNCYSFCDFLFSKHDCRSPTLLVSFKHRASSLDGNNILHNNLICYEHREIHGCGTSTDTSYQSDEKKSFEICHFCWLSLFDNAYCIVRQLRSTCNIDMSNHGYFSFNNALCLYSGIFRSLNEWNNS